MPRSHTSRPTTQSLTVKILAFSLQNQGIGLRDDNPQHDHAIVRGANARDAGWTLKKVKNAVIRTPQSKVRIVKDKGFVVR
jgi:hypothetical protein